MTHYVSNTYAVRIRLYTEPNQGGNMSEYWLKGRNGDKLLLCGRAGRKVYLSRSWADKACYAVQAVFNDAVVSVVTI